jgi:uncharacterized protein
VRVSRILEIEPEEVPFPPDQVVAGSPRRFDTVVARSPDGRVADGVYKVTPGRFEDVQVGRESFVVIAGRATVEFAGTDERIDLRPGDWVNVDDAEVSTWTVHETLVGAYVQFDA